MKKLLRSKYKEIRRSIIDKEDRDNIIFNRVINNAKVIDADTLLIYVSNEEEVDTINIIKYFINKKKIGVPRIDNGVMNFYYINSLDELMEGYFGILEPISNNKIEVGIFRYILKRNSKKNKIYYWHRNKTTRRTLKRYTFKY